MFACMNICTPHICLIPNNVRRGLWIPWTGVNYVYESPCGCWEQSLCPLNHCAVFPGTFLTPAHSSRTELKLIFLPQGLSVPASPTGTN